MRCARPNLAPTLILRVLAAGFSGLGVACTAGSAPAPAVTSDGGLGDAAEASSCAEGCRGAKCQASGCGETCLWRCARAEYVAGVVTCLNEPTTVCDAKADDACGAKALAALSAQPNEAEFTTACSRKRTDCGGTFPDDYCLQPRALTAGCFSEAQACITKPCSEVRACLSSVYK